MAMTGKAMVCAAALGLALSTTVAAAQPRGRVAKSATKVPARFAAALGKLDGFRLDTRSKGWEPATPCRTESHKTGCALLKESWNALTVKHGTRGADVVVQELWLLRYQTAVQAEQAVRSFNTEFNEGPFGKHPFKLHQCGEYVLGVEGRFRSPTPLKQLSASLGKAMGKRCKPGR